MTVAVMHYPLNSIPFWLTHTIERDFVRRGVFPALRAETAIEVEASRRRSLHILAPSVAAEVLADAKDARGRPQAQRGLNMAYTCHIKHLMLQIDDAEHRAAISAAPSAKRTYENTYTEGWYGSRRQLEASDFTIASALPGEDGCSARSVTIRDPRGYKASAQLVSGLWRDFYSVTVQLPDEHRERLKEAKAAESEREREKYFTELRLKIGPTTPAAFRKQASERFWKYVRMTVMELEGQYGYRLDESSIERFVDTASEAFHIIMDGTVSGHSLKDQQAITQRDAARNDRPLQRFLAQCKSEGPEGNA